MAVDNINAASGLTDIYPNPSSGKFSIKSSVVSNQSSVEVYDVLGKQVYSQFFIVDFPISIDLFSNPSGVYLYRVIANNGELIGEGKLIIQE